MTSVQIIGEKPCQFEAIENWARLPRTWRLSDVAAVAADNVYLFTRGNQPIIVLNSLGDVLLTRILYP